MAVVDGVLFVEPGDVRVWVAEQEEAEGGPSLASIPFYSLCKGLLLPLSGMSIDKAGTLFGIVADPPPDTAGREALLKKFLDRDVGLSLVQKLSCILGDPFRGGPATLKRDSLIRLLLSIDLKTHRQLIDRMTVVGDPAVLFA